MILIFSGYKVKDVFDVGWRHFATLEKNLILNGSIKTIYTLTYPTSAQKLICTNKDAECWNSDFYLEKMK